MYSSPSFGFNRSLLKPPMLDDAHLRRSRPRLWIKDGGTRSD
jgi:hypothetical protein